jgi:hypothetical protein
MFAGWPLLQRERGQGVSQKKYDPYAKKRYKVGSKVEFFGRREQIFITEIKRPEPEAILILYPDAEIELTNEEVRVLFDQDAGPLLPKSILTELPSAEELAKAAAEAAEKAKAAAEAAAKAKAEAEAKAKAEKAEKAEADAKAKAEKEKATK